MTSETVRIHVYKYVAITKIKAMDKAPVKILVNYANHARYDFAVAYHKQSNSVFIVGGYVDGLKSSSVWRFCVNDGKFYAVPSMLQERS